MAYFLLMSNCIMTVQGNKLNNTQADLLLRKADIAYQEAQFVLAAEYYNSYLLTNVKNTARTQQKLADCYWQMRNYEKALQVYKQIYPTVNSDISQQDKQRMAELYARNNQYQEASKWLKQVPGFSLKAKVYSEKAALDKMKKDSLNWTLGFSAINSNYRDFSPFLKNDTLFFSSNKPLQENTTAFGWDGNNFTHIWQVPMSQAEKIQADHTVYTTLFKVKSVKHKKSLAGVYECGSNPVIKNNFGANPTSKKNLNGESGQVGILIDGLDEMQYNVSSLSMDKNNQIYFSSNYKRPDKKGTNRIRLMEGHYSADGVTNIKKLPFGDANAYSVMHPAVNRDGTILICCSDMPNGMGGYDLYYTSRVDSVHDWDALKAFGGNVNTNGNEVFPCITRDSILYFSSDGMPGLGGLDIYKISLTNALKGIGEAEHISYPINSSADDFGWTQDSTGTKGFFSSDRFSNNDNIYSFNYQPIKIVKKLIYGFVKEKGSLKPLQGSTVFLFNPKEDSVYVAKTDKDGKYKFLVPSSEELIIKAIDKSYINDCFVTKINTEEQMKDTIQNAPRDLLLNKFKVGFVWKLSNIRYDFNKANIRADAAPVLDSLVMILNEYPITIELGSHTDSRGSMTYNEKLSQHRAESAVKYLIKKGIDPKRITAKGYGESQLLNRCVDGVPCTEAEHQVNRRTEVKVIGYTIPQKEPEEINPDKFKNGEKMNKNQLPENFFSSCQ